MIYTLKMRIHHKTVMCFGTFDLLHLGHLHYLKQARKHGNYLMAVVARDSTKRQQGRKPVFDEQERLELLQSLKVVDEAVLGNQRDFLKIIRQRKPEVLCLGYDHAIQEDELRRKLGVPGYSPRVVRADPYKPVTQKSHRIRRALGI